MQLIEPALSSYEAKNIDRLINIYMDLNPSNSIINSNVNDVVVHTLHDCLKDGQVEKMFTQAEQNGNSIWREAPGWRYSYSSYLSKKKKKNHEN